MRTRSSSVDDNESGKREVSCWIIISWSLSDECLQIESLSVTFHGHELVADSTLELNYGRYAISCFFPSLVTEVLNSRCCERQCLDEYVMSSLNNHQF